MKKILLSYLILAFAFGCSGEGAGYDIDPETGEELELGTAEQPVIYLNGSNTQWGAQTGSSNRACNKTSTSQVCTFSKFKKIDVSITGSQWTADQTNQILGVTTILNGTFTGWTFPLSDASSSPPADGVRLAIQKNTGGGGNNGNDIKNYNAITFHSQTAMTEGQHSGLATPVGNYQHHGSCSGTIYLGRIEAKTSSATQRNRLLRHALGNLVTRCMGVGTRSSSPGVYSQDAISLSSDLSGATSGEVCRASISEMNDLADISRQTASSCSGD